jgi:hypothetical protein
MLFIFPALFFQFFFFCHFLLSPLQPEILILLFYQNISQADQLILIFLFFCLQRIDILLQFIVLFFGLLHHLVYELNAPVLVLDLGAGIGIESTFLRLFSRCFRRFPCTFGAPL